MLRAAATYDDNDDDDVVDTMISGDLPEHMSPYVFFIVFNDTTFMPFNRNETSHVNTHTSVSLSLSLYTINLTLAADLSHTMSVDIVLFDVCTCLYTFLLATPRA